tara:strand:+ start:2118 stop:2288 length:171 start_codon:yes stop_codon:yes gene_type:complete
MDGDLMNKLHGNLNQLSEESMRILLNYYENATLTLEDRNFVLNDLINEQDIIKELE